MTTIYEQIGGEPALDAAVNRMEHLGATLKERNVPAELAGQMAAIAESTRDDVLGK